MNLVIDIGNTCTKAGWFDDGILLESCVITINEASDIVPLLSHYPVDRAMVSSVALADGLLQAMESLRKVLVLDSYTRLPVSIDYDTPETLGRDRIAAAVGAWHQFPGCNIVVIDMGTAITIDLVTADGVFRGGNISPGLRTRYRSLHDYTARLPLVNINEAFPSFGRDTETAIAAGVQQGILYELNGYFLEFEKRYDGCVFVITGGDAGLFVPKLKRAIFAMPDLVLTGLNHILEFNTPDT